MKTSPSTTIRQLLHEGTALLTRAGIDSPRLSAEVLVAHSLQLERLDILMDQGRCLEAHQIRSIHALFQRRARGEPVAYLTGTREFYGLTFEVDQRVLIPRPETELLVDAVLETFASRDLPCLADVCTGSGVLGIVLAVHFPGLVGVLTDVSAQALDVARSNLIRHNLDSRLFCVRTDVMDSLQAESMDCIVANPPYIKSSVVRELSREVRDFEPCIALDGGPLGTSVCRKVLGQAARVLKPGGWLFMEIEDGQFQALDPVKAQAAGIWQDWRLIRDYQHLERFVAARKLWPPGTTCG